MRDASGAFHRASYSVVALRPPGRRAAQPWFALLEGHLADDCDGGKFIDQEISHALCLESFDKAIGGGYTATVVSSAAIHIKANTPAMPVAFSVSEDGSALVVVAQEYERVLEWVGK